MFVDTNVLVHARILEAPDNVYALFSRPPKAAARPSAWRSARPGGPKRAGRFSTRAGRWTGYTVGGAVSLDGHRLPFSDRCGSLRESTHLKR